MESENNSLVDELNEIYGLDNDVETILNYAKYIDLKSSEKIKDIGNYNMIIKCSQNNQSITSLINIIIKLLTEKEIIKEVNYCFDTRQLNYRDKFDFVNELVIIDNGSNSDIRRIQERPKQYIHSRTNKVFILILYLDEYEDTHIFDQSFLEEFAWYVKIEDLSGLERQEYIRNKLKKNHIAVSKKCDFVAKLAEHNSIIIDDELLDVVIKCKTSGIKTITDLFLKNNGKTELLSSTNTQQHSKSAMKELDLLIGLEDIKYQLKQIINYVKVSKTRGQRPMLHFCFLGSSGTGKTQVAKILAKLFEEENIISSNKFVEVTRADLVAGYVGQSALKTKAVLNKAKNGVLFIDECYSLLSENSRDYGHEVVAELVKFMEEDKKTIIIFAGYTEAVQEFLKSNEGLESRIQFKLYFKNYTPEELYSIFKKMVCDKGYKIASNLKNTLVEHFIKAQKQQNFR